MGAIMASVAKETEAPRASPDVVDEIGHPRGTLAILLVFGLLFALGWFAAYLAFMGRGVPHH
jgi:hypothetical protein